MYIRVFYVNRVVSLSLQYEPMHNLFSDCRVTLVQFIRVGIKNNYCLINNSIKN